MGKFVDLTNREFGRLKVISRAEDYISPKGYSAVNWLCLCRCGKTTVVRGCNLKSGATTSCGCKRVDNPNHKRHGGTNTRLYKIWCSMRTRCNNVNDSNYADYGARGISICDDWGDI